jgi:acetyl esterase/lipase
MYVKPLTQAGYTVFAVNHRAAPRFRYPAAVEDVERAVRFVRHHAARYAIRPDRIGGVGGSSGGHLVSLLGTLDGKGDPEDPDPVNRESTRLQCIVARAAPVDMAQRMAPAGASFLGMPLNPAAAKTSVEYKTYREASPLYHVSADDPPWLLLHGDADTTVPFEQSVWMEQALAKAGVKVKLLRVPGGGHGPSFPGATNPPDYLGEMVRWLDQYLRNTGSN